MRIAVFLPNWIGDAVMATPALRAVRQNFPAARLIGVLRPYVAGVLEGTPWLDRLLFLDPKGSAHHRLLAVADELRRERVDLAILFRNSFHCALVAWLGRCRHRVGYARYGRSLLLTDRLPPVRGPRGRLVPSPVIDAYNRLAEHVGCARPSYRMELATLPRDERAADQVWAAAGFTDRREVVCFHAGAAFGSAKYWPAEYFGQLARDLADCRGSGVLVLCGPGEEALARQVTSLAGHPGVVSLEGRPLSIGLTKACVRRADLLVTTDSGPRHFAAAFDRPVVTLFGPTHIAWTETYHAKAVLLQKPVPCGPCQLRVCPLDHRCMTGLTPDEVLRAAEALLARFPATAKKAG
jgi:heptosyltransferase-2